MSETGRTSAKCKNCPQPLVFAFGRWEHVETASVWCDQTSAEPIPETDQRVACHGTRAEHDYRCGVSDRGV